MADHPEVARPLERSSRARSASTGGTSTDVGGDGREMVDPTELRREQKVQALGKTIILTLFMLVRNVKIHAPDNAIFLKPVDILREAMNRALALDRGLDLQAVDTSVYLNRTRLRLEFAALDSVSYLTREFENANIGGFTARRPVTSQEIRDFLHLFTASHGGRFAEDEVDGAKLPSLRLSRYTEVKELIAKLQADADIDQQIDRKKYLLTVYARAILYMRQYFERVAEGEYSLPFAKAARLVRDFVDLSHRHRAHFLGVTTCRSDSEYLPYHSVNTCLLSIVFGAELGLDKRQLHDLGMAALFSQIGLGGIPEVVLSRPSGLSPEERRLIDLYPLRSAKKILFARGLDKTTMNRIVAGYESKVDFAIPQRVGDHEIKLVLPKVGLGVFGKVIAICETYDALTSKRPYRDAYGPELALALMWGEIRYKFDPVLLRVFMRVMAIQPIRILDEGERDLRIG